jgi:hypothetical protein
VLWFLSMQSTLTPLALLLALYYRGCRPSTFASGRHLAKTADSAALQTYGFALPTVEGYFSGVGDLFSALVLAFFKKELIADASDDCEGEFAVEFAAHPAMLWKPLQRMEAGCLVEKSLVADASDDLANTDNERDSSRPDNLPPFAAAVSKALLGVQQINPIPDRTARSPPLPVQWMSPSRAESVLSVSSD